MNQTNPKTITIYGDSYTKDTMSPSDGVVFGTAGAIGAGLGGTDAAVFTRAAGGCSLAQAVGATARPAWDPLAWPSPTANPFPGIGAGADLQAALTSDLGGYVMLRYGINDVLQHTLTWGASSFASFGERRYHFETRFEAYLRAAIGAVRGAGKKPILYVPPTLPVKSSGVPGWEWTTVNQGLLADGLRPKVLALAAEFGLPVVDQSPLSYPASQLVDWIHLDAPRMHSLSINCGAQLRSILSAGY